MEEQTHIKTYAEVKAELQPAFPTSERIDLVTVLNTELLIVDFKAFPSSLTEGKEFVVVLAELNGKLISFNCGEIVLKQLRDVKPSLPLRATITRQKGKRYYTLS